MKNESMDRIEYLLSNSNLPGPRGNLKLLYEFSKDAGPEETDLCLEYITPDVSNSPEEFAGMCGILSYALANREDMNSLLAFLKKYVNHSSWRIREAVAISIQETAADSMEQILSGLGDFAEGTSLEKRAVVAGLCEPKLLKNKASNIKILELLFQISLSLDHDNKPDDGETSLRKALGYGWSVVISNEPEAGKEYFGRLFLRHGKHIKWIIRENLKKDRLKKIDPQWVEACIKKVG